jgi:hypothetical protein
MIISACFVLASGSIALVVTDLGVVLSVRQYPNPVSAFTSFSAYPTQAMPAHSSSL